MMFVEAILALAREKLVTVSVDAQLMDAAKLLTAGTDIVVVCAANGALVGVVNKTDVVRQISTCKGSISQSPAVLVMTRKVLTCREKDRVQDVLS